MTQAPSMLDDLGLMHALIWMFNRLQKQSGLDINFTQNIVDEKFSPEINAFFIGRGVNYPVALEGALKLKEISYIHAEGYAAGEMKHGPFALLYPGVPIIALMCQDANYDSMVTSIKEVKARNAYVIAVADENDTRIDGLADEVIRVPHTHFLLSPVVNTVALQLLSYYAANVRGCPIDFPRNLAKSVTVE